VRVLAKPVTRARASCWPGEIPHKIRARFASRISPYAVPVTKPASALSPERRPFVPFVIVTDSSARYCVPTGDGPAPSAKTLGEALGVQGLNYFFASRDPKVTGIRSNILSFWPPSVGRAQRQLLTPSERYQPANSGDRPALSWQSLALAHLSFILKYGRLKDFHRSQEFRAAPLSQNQ
jgi:hypothetical protein